MNIKRQLLFASFCIVVTAVLLSCHPSRRVFVRNLCDSPQRIQVGHSGKFLDDPTGRDIVLIDTIIHLDNEFMNFASGVLMKDSIDDHSYSIDIPPSSMAFIKPIWYLQSLKYFVKNGRDTLYLETFGFVRKEFTKAKGRYLYQYDLCPPSLIEENIDR